ncbi:MAG: TldD/PmbA family protein [Proteobacteria bacterium]|nr:TldD/PmbA family protein [Pseudomonadota bacterium]
MSADLQASAATAIETLKAAGAEDAWASVLQSRNVDFNYRDGALEKVQDTTARMLAVQVYANGRYSTHQTTDLNPDRLANFLKEAVAITNALEPDPQRNITPPELFANRPDIALDLSDEVIQRLDREQRMEWCVLLDQEARKHERVISATSRVSSGTQTRVEASSNGFSGAEESTYCVLGANITLKDRGDRRASDGFSAVARHVGDVPDAISIAKKALEYAVARLDSQKGPTMKSTMVVDSRVAASLIGRLMGPANARSVQQGRSFWADLLGKQAFSHGLTIIDDPLVIRGLASRQYDSEGISAKALPIVEEGVIRNIYVDTYYGRKADMPPTTGSPSNRRVGTGNKSLDELIGDAGDGVYVTSWLGGNADGTTGDFSLGLSGHLIENGRVGRPVGEMNVTGNLRDLFSRLEATGNDPFPYSGTLAPSMVFSGVDFSGT